jgi:hypothetical protein
MRTAIGSRVIGISRRVGPPLDFDPRRDSMSGIAMPNRQRFFRKCKNSGSALKMQNSSMTIAIIGSCSGCCG